MKELEDACMHMTAGICDETASVGSPRKKGWEAIIEINYCVEKICQ